MFYFEQLLLSVKSASIEAIVIKWFYAAVLFLYPLNT